MNGDEFQASLVHEEPPDVLSAPLQALWWDAKRKLDSCPRIGG